MLIPPDVGLVSLAPHVDLRLNLQVHLGVELGVGVVQVQELVDDAGYFRRISRKPSVNAPMEGEAERLAEGEARLAALFFAAGRFEAVDLGFDGLTLTPTLSIICLRIVYWVRSHWFSSRNRFTTTSSLVKPSSAIRVATVMQTVRATASTCWGGTVAAT
jgi:hypothetical protein